MSLIGYITGSNKRNLLRNLIDDGSEIIDIRDSKDYLRSHIQGARNIPAHLIPAKADEFKGIKQPLILYGEKKGDADESVEFLKKKGIAAVNGGTLSKMQLLTL